MFKSALLASVAVIVLTLPGTAFAIDNETPLLRPSIVPSAIDGRTSESLAPPAAANSSTLVFSKDSKEAKPIDGAKPAAATPEAAASLQPAEPGPASAPAAAESTKLQDAPTAQDTAKTDEPAPPAIPVEAGVPEKLKGLIEAKLDQAALRKDERAGVEAFYRERNFKPLWTSNDGPQPQAKQAVEFLRGVAADGLDPADYAAPAFAETTPEALAADELKLTRSVLRFARHASIGRVAFTRVSAAIWYNQQAPNTADILRKLADSTDVRATLDSFNPHQAGYKALKSALAAERASPESKPARVATIAANMERWRWLPHDVGSDYVMVNIPDYTLRVVDDGKTIWTTKIVSGKPGKLQTPLIAETMKYITVNPTWNVPPSIIRNEYLPVMQRDPGALARTGLKVAHNKDGSLRIYQPPGAKNALGRIRFNFPNRFLVYQHDTPQKHLFDKAERAFSHGCMRVQNPEQYAQVLLSVSQPEEHYTAARIRAMYGDNERSITFKKPIPVYVTYQTVFVDDAGQLQFRADVYGHDKEIIRLMRDERQVADVPMARDYSSGSKPVMARGVATARSSGGRDRYAQSYDYGTTGFGSGWTGGMARRGGPHSAW